MVATDQQILDAAKDALYEILLGKSEEFREGNESARLLRIQELRGTIQEYEAKVNVVNGSTFKQIREVDI